MTMTEKDVNEAMLKVAARKGRYGVTKDEIFKALKGIAYGELERLIEDLAQKGYITIDWLGEYDFVITVTPEGIEQLNDT